MTIDIKGTTGTAAAGAVESAESIALTASMPFEISDDQVKAAIERGGAETSELNAKLHHCHRYGEQLDAGDVESLVKRAHRHGRADGNQAIVMAYYAQKHREVFAPGAFKTLTKFFKSIDWNALMADLKKFIEDLKAKEAEQKKADQIKADRLKDDIKRDDAKRTLVKDNGTKADRQRELRKTEAEKHEHKERIKEAAPGEIDEELTASGRLQLSDVERTKLGLMKKGFANND